MADHHLSRILSANAQWAKDTDSTQPGFFAKQAQGQSPKILWIGCSDSRVPESVITASTLGDIFVHRNIANQFLPDDVSAHAVLQYAVEHLGVQHVIVVGHTQCGGAAACFAAARSASENAAEIIPVPSHPPTDPINRWLKSLTSLATSLSLTKLAPEEGIPKLVEENVKAQVATLVKTDTIKKAWQDGKEISVHGWVFEIESGKLRDLGISSHC